MRKTIPQGVGVSEMGYALKRQYFVEITFIILYNVQTNLDVIVKSL